MQTLDDVETPELTMREIGRRGGTAVKAKYGKEHFSRIGKLAAAVNRKRYGHEWRVETGRRGGERARELREQAKAARQAGEAGS